MKAELIILNFSEDDLKQLIRDEMEEIITRITEMTRNDDLLLSAKEVCQYLSINNSTLWRWGKAGIVHPVRIGGKVRYKKSEISKLIETT